MAPRRRSGDAADHVTGECERLFCGTLKAVFLVEKDGRLETSLVTGARNWSPSGRSGGAESGDGRAVRVSAPPQQQPPTVMKHDLPTPSPSPDGRIYPQAGGMVRDYVEVWDYAGSARFRGFVAEKEDERALFIFFDREVIGKDLKPGLMALLELASSQLECQQLVACVDRTADPEAAEDLTRDLKWVGFELMMLDSWAGAKACISDRWLFLGMDM